MTFPPGIRAVSFDVGGTLIDPWPSVGHIYAAVANEMGLASPAPAVLNAQFGAAWRSKVSFEYSRSDWAGLVVSTFGGSPEQIGLGSPFFERLYNRFIDADVWRVYDDVLPTLDILRVRGLKLAAISNWDDRLRPLLRNLKLDRYFDAIEISGESGHHKPSPLIFERAVQSLHVPPGTVLHVGDGLEEDVRGARAAGLRAVWLRRSQAATAPNEITSLAELPRLLQAI